MEGWMEAAHSPWQGPRQLHSLGMGDAGSPRAGWGAAHRGQSPCPLATNQTERSLSDHPWHIPPWRGREEEHKPRRDAVEEEQR